MQCKCRNCDEVYEEAKSRADFKGYCSQKCLHEKARALGFSKGLSANQTEYQVLKRAGEVGSVPWKPVPPPASQKLKAVHEVHLRITPECDDEPATDAEVRAWVLNHFEDCDYGRVEVVDPPADEDPLRHYSEGQQAKALDKLADDVATSPHSYETAAGVFGRPDED